MRRLRYDLAARALNQFRGAATQAGRFAEVFADASPALSGFSRERRADPNWHRAYRSIRQIASLVPPRAAFILVDEDKLNAQVLLAPRRCFPFLEKDGGYWGKPADDAAAIAELVRLQNSGARFIVFAGPALWWLDHYAGFAQYLRAHFQCANAGENLVVFDLTKTSAESRRSKSKGKTAIVTAIPSRTGIQ